MLIFIALLSGYVSEEDALNCMRIKFVSMMGMKMNKGNTTKHIEGYIEVKPRIRENI